LFARSSCALVTRQVMLDGYRWHKHLMRDSRISGYIFGYHLSDQYGTSSGQNPPVKSDQERKPHRCVIYSAGDISLSSLIILHRSRRMAMRIRGAMSVVVGMRSSLPGGRGQQIQELQVQGPCSGIYSDSNVSERYSQQGQKPQRKQTVPAIIYRISLSLFWWFRRVEGIVRTIHGLSDLGAACDELMFFLPLADAFTRVDRKVARNAGDSVWRASREAILREKGKQLRIYIACDTNGTDR